MSDGLFGAGREVLSTLHLVLNDELRQAIKESYGAMNALSNMHGVPVRQAQAASDQAIERYDRALNRIGQRIRELLSSDANALGLLTHWGEPGSRV